MGKDTPPRLTPQRRRILDLLRHSPTGLTIREIVAALADGAGRSGAGQATVYRAVKALGDHGLVAFVHDTDGEHRYVCPSADHAHRVVCRGCGQTREFLECDLEALETLVASRTGFAVHGHHLEMFGLCPGCQTR